MSNAVVSLNPETWDDQVLAADGPVLVDFWATWCPPCRMIAPVLERLAEEHQGRLTVAKLDVDGAPELSERYGVRSIPTLILFRDGEILARVVGALPIERLRDLVEPHLELAAAERTE